MAASDLAALVASLGISLWTQRSFKQPLLASSLACLAGEGGGARCSRGDVRACIAGGLGETFAMHHRAAHSWTDYRIRRE